MAAGLRILNASCRDAARLLSDRRERRLSRAERVGLVLHLAICRHCRTYGRQLAVISTCLARRPQTGDVSDEGDDGPALSPEAKGRIVARLEGEGGND